LKYATYPWIRKWAAFYSNIRPDDFRLGRLVFLKLYLRSLLWFKDHTGPLLEAEFQVLY